ncbi:MAG: hypothetical protein RL755_527 [Pseudomonadota bacterium]|jgi:hypothetical protein
MSVITACLGIFLLDYTENQNAIAKARYQAKKRPKLET